MPLRVFRILLAAALAVFSLIDQTAAEDRQNMMDQLGIKSLRPGRAAMRAPQSCQL